MTEHLFIAEKSSLAEEVAKAWGERTGRPAQKQSTHWAVGGDAVTWLSGHMYQQVQPQEYDARYSRWSVEDLPIVPVKWRLVPAKDRDGKPKTQRIKEIQALIKGAAKVVNVGDAGREGQLLVDEVLVEAGRDPFGSDVQRLWVKSLARKDMLQAMSEIGPNAAKRNLYEAAVTRQRADWVHGMNMTRLVTVLAQRSGLATGKPLSVGRVQTPTLRLVVDRDREVERFKPVDHFLPTGSFVHANGTFKASWVIPPDHDGLDHEGRLVDRAVADRVCAKVAGRSGPVESFDVSKKSKSPPLPYALSNLQKECSAKFGFSVTKTLEVAQKLYEKKLTTYPRSDSQYLPMAIYTDEAPAILDNLSRGGPFQAMAQGATRSLRSAAWNDAKVSDHHAIIPTTEALPSTIAGLPKEEADVFALIARAFVAQFHPDHLWDATTVVLSVDGERFRGTGRRVTVVGWKAVYGMDAKDEDEEEEGAALPQMVKGDTVTAEAVVNEAKRTKPPSYFTEGTLVDAMKNVHRFVQDGEVKKRLKENAGIGTEATRASIIETIKDRQFVAAKGKFIVSTPVARDLIDALDPKLKDPALTALWEDQLEKVTQGTLTGEKFMAVLVREVTANVEALGNATLRFAGSQEPLPGSGEPCPACGKGKLRTQNLTKGEHKGKRFLSCDNYSKEDPASCRFSKWPDDPKRPTVKIDGDGETCPTCGKGKLVTRTIGKGEHKGKSFLSCDAFSKEDPASCRHTQWPQPTVEPLPDHGSACPKCGKGKMMTKMVRAGEHKGKRFLSCDNYRKDDPTSCGHSAWPQVKVDPLPGDGDACPACGKGHMRTRKSAKTGDRFLSCDAYKKDDPASCRHAEWPRPKVEPLAGEGVLCEKCAAGRMKTRSTKDGRSFLSCDGYDPKDERSCRHAVWPDRDAGGGGKGKVGAKPGGKPASAKAATGARKTASKR